MQSTGAALSYTGTASGDQLSLQVAADPNNANAQTLTLVPPSGTAGSILDQENGVTTTLVSYTGIALPVNLTVVTPGPTDQIEMSASSGTAQFQSTNSPSTFGTVTVPFNASTVVALSMEAGSNALTIDSSVAAAVQAGGQITVQGGGIQTQNTDNDSIGVLLPTSANAQTLALVPGATATDGSIQENGATVVTYSGIKQPVNLTVTGATGPVEMVTASTTAGTVNIESTSSSVPAFGTVNVSLNAGTVVGLNMAAGTNSVTIDSSVQVAILKGGGQIAMDEGSGSSNTLISNSSQNAWDITGQNQGTLNSNISFTDVGNLSGSPGDTQDEFVFSDQASVSGMVAGGGGTDTTTLDYSKYASNVAVNFGTGAATGTGSAANFNTLIGAGGTNSSGIAATTTLTGPTADSVWDVTGADSGTLALANDVTDLWNTASSGTFTISASVNGGAAQTTAYSLNWNATAAQVQNALNLLTGVSVSVTGLGTAANPWVIVGTSKVTLTANDSLTGGSSTVQIVPGTTVLNFSGVGNLTGAAANRDAFIIEQAGSVSGTITGVATANDGLIVQDAGDDSYTVVNPQTGTNNQITVNSQTITYSDLAPFVQNGTTTIYGGEVDSQWSLAADRGVESITVTEGGSGYTSTPDVAFAGGGGSGAAGTAVLTNGVVTSVTITDPGSGYTSAPFVSFTGGGGTDAMATATATPSGQMTITNLNGNFYDAASQLYVGYLNFATPTTPLTVSLGDGSSSITLDAITGVPEVNINGGAGSNTLISDQGANHIWNITGVDSGNVTGYGSTVNFSNIGTLFGGDQDDTFVYSQGASEKGVEGGGGSVVLDGTTTIYPGNASAPNTSNSIVFAGSDDFVQGEQVTYVSNLAASADTSGLTPNSIYYVNVINAQTIQLSLTNGGSPVTLGTNPWAAGTNLLEPVKTLDYSADSNVSVTLGLNNSDINNVIGGSGTDNSLVGVADDNVWTISGTNSGTVVTTRHDTTALNGATVVYTSTDTTSGTTPNSIVFPVSDGFFQGEQVTYVRTYSTLQTAGGGSEQLWNNAGGGVFTISTTVNGSTETTGNIVWNADAVDVQTALNQLQGVSVTVTGLGTAGPPLAHHRHGAGVAHDR